jgi:hypothetical protein
MRRWFDPTLAGQEFVVLREEMKTVIHVNQHVIKANAKTGDNDPVLTVKTYKSNDYAHQANILDAQGNVVARVVYSPDKPLSCGARVWIETENSVQMV